MQTNKTKIWFPAKKYGWGWGPPCSWQGWVVMAVWLVLLLGGGFLLAPHNKALFLAYTLVLAVALCIVAYVKGEKPRWRWGEPEKNELRSLSERLAGLEEQRRRHLISPAEYEARRQEIFKER